MSDNKMLQILIDGQVYFKKEFSKVNKRLDKLDKRLDVIGADVAQLQDDAKVGAITFKLAPLA